MTADPRATVLFAVLFAALGLPQVAAPAFAAAGVACSAERAGQRALITIGVTQLFDRELLHLVELGLVGRLHIEATLYRRRSFWFDPRLAESTQLYSIAWSKEDKRFTLEGQPIASPYDFALPLLALRPEDEELGRQVLARDDGYYVDVLMRLEVITPTSLGQVARWLVTSPAPTSDGAEPAAGTSAGTAPPTKTLVPRALLNFLAADLARTARGSCPVAR